MRLHSVAAEGFVIGMASFGAIVEKHDENGEFIYISVPETSDHKDVNGNEMAGMFLAKRLKESLSNLGVPVKIKARIRKGDHWTKEKEEWAKAETANVIRMSR